MELSAGDRPPSMLGRRLIKKDVSMIAKLLVLIASLGAIWLFFKMAGKIGRQNKELQVRRTRDAERKAEAVQRREENIIDVEFDSDSGSFEEKKDRD